MIAALDEQLVTNLASRSAPTLFERREHNAFWAQAWDAHREETAATVAGVLDAVGPALRLATLTAAAHHLAEEGMGGASVLLREYAGLPALEDVPRVVDVDTGRLRVVQPTPLTAVLPFRQRPPPSGDGHPSMQRGLLRRLPRLPSPSRGEGS